MNLYHGKSRALCAGERNKQREGEKMGTRTAVYIYKQQNDVGEWRRRRRNVVEAIRL